MDLGRACMRTLGGGRSESEGVVLSELAEAVLRARTGEGIIPQVIEEAHGKKSVACFSRSDPSERVPGRCCMRCIFNDGEALKVQQIMVSGTDLNRR